MNWQQLDWQPVWLTLQLAVITTVILLLLGVPLAYCIAHSRSRFKPVWESLVSMPLVLPPSVLGFYLLLIFSPRYAFGQWLEQTLHLKLVFSFSGLVIGSVLFSLPFMVQPVQAAFQYLPRSLLEASRTLGKSDTESFPRDTAIGASGLTQWHGTGVRAYDRRIRCGADDRREYSGANAARVDGNL
jgi:molybdate transport system permease protein